MDFIAEMAASISMYQHHLLHKKKTFHVHRLLSSLIFIRDSLFWFLFWRTMLEVLQLCFLFGPRAKLPFVQRPDRNQTCSQGSPPQTTHGGDNTEPEVKVPAHVNPRDHFLNNCHSWVTVSVHFQNECHPRSQAKPGAHMDYLEFTARYVHPI